jgi:murein DD-endopeptidase MepM/ murein hydrolase activator NlpD
VTSPGQFTGRFFGYLLVSNRPRLNGFKHWLFHPGMLFQSRQQWWGQEKSRLTPHEGLDLCWFADVTGKRRNIDHTITIPVAFPGTVVKISCDFLGQSIFVAHDIFPEPGRRLYTALGHTDPRAGLAVGQKVVEGEIIAGVSAPAKRKTTVPPHLHITLALIPDSIPAAQLTWDNLSAEPTITLLDPLAFFPTPYAILPSPGD